MFLCVLLHHRPGQSQGLGLERLLDGQGEGGVLLDPSELLLLLVCVRLVSITETTTLIGHYFWMSPVN